MTTAYRPPHGQPFNTIEDLVSDFFGDHDDLSPDHRAAPSGSEVDPEIEQIIEGYAGGTPAQTPISSNSTAGFRVEASQTLEQLKGVLGQRQLTEEPEIQTPLQRLETFVTTGVDREIRSRQQKLRQVTESLIEALTQAGTPDQQLKVLVGELHRLLKADRVVIYGAESQTVVAEAVTRGYTPMQDQQLPPLVFGLPDVQILLRQPLLAISSPRRLKLTPYQQQLWQQYQINATLALPLIEDGQLWGVLGIQQCRQPRAWQDLEVELVSRAISEWIRSRQQARYVQQLQEATARERAVTRIIDRIRQSVDIQEIYRTSTQELRELLNCDRVGIYRFNPDWSGQFVAESVAPGWISVLQEQQTNTALLENISDCSAKDLTKGANQSNTQVRAQGRSAHTDTYLQRTQGGMYSQGTLYRVTPDIYNEGFSQCYLDILKTYQARAYVIVAIYQGQTLWGLLAAYQNSGPRQWQESDVSVLLQVAPQMGIAQQQAEYLQQLTEARQREQAITKIITRIRQSLDIDRIFKTTTQELRQVLGCDRVGIYRFNPDWSGQFVSESVGSGWVKLLEEQQDNPDLLENISDCSARDLAQGRGPASVDTYLQNTKGGAYSRGEIYRTTDDIYQAGFSPCYIQILETYQARAYMIVAIYQGENLWGLLAAYQNSGPRQWQESEINILLQVAPQLGIALQQAEFVNQVQQQSQQLAEAAQREKAAKDELQQRVIQLLNAVQPALDGDLTVRAQVTEDEVGTIAGLYNNTLQSLSQLVTQVKASANQVSHTSQQNQGAIADLSQRAKQQLQALAQAIQEIQAMSQSSEQVVSRVAQVEAAVQAANQTVHQGDEAMNSTVEGILAVQETVSETREKIARLQESSEKISKVIGLISGFATQTNLLALNAAIEASRAGEYGRGFGVVADEVRSLARQSATATTEIERLVQEIQAETQEVAEAMEQGIQRVSEGTERVNLTRHSLTAIVTATDQITELIQAILESTQAQEQQAHSVTQQMENVAQIANSTDLGAQGLSQALQELLTTAQSLQSSVDQFKVR